MLMTELELPKNCSMKNKCPSPLISLSLSLSLTVFSLLLSSSSLQFQPSSSTNTRLLETQLYRQLCIHTFKQWGCEHQHQLVCATHITKETGEPSKSNPKGKRRRSSKQKRENGSGGGSSNSYIPLESHGKSRHREKCQTCRNDGRLSTPIRTFPTKQKKGDPKNDLGKWFTKRRENVTRNFAIERNPGSNTIGGNCRRNEKNK